MFERRLKIMLAIIAGFTLLLLVRAGWLQVVQGDEWQRRAAATGRRSSPIETIRGPITDINGRVIAEDAPCIDAAVDYRAIAPDAKESQEWLRIQARQRLQARGVFKGDRDDKARLIDAEIARIKDDLNFLWNKLAQLSGKSPDDIEHIKENIKRRVQTRQKYVVYKRYEEAKERHEQKAKEPTPAWYRWLVDDNAPGPNLESFEVTVSEQTEAHVILRAIDNDTYLELDKLRERCPGLELRKGTHRYYPYGDLGCHLVGHLAPVMKEDLEGNDKREAQKRYAFNDLIGRSGIERMGEDALRGARGLVIRQTGNDTVLQTIAPEKGSELRITIDMDLQKAIQTAFQNYKEQDDPLRATPDLRVRQIPVHEMHGAAVVIHVPTGQLRAMVSYPTYDINQFDQLYPTLAADRINQPLLNRATQSALEPGSTVKPLVGLSAITAGLCGVHETVECTGYLVFDGRRMQGGKCWVASKFGHLLPSVAHHPIPSRAPHPTGFLTFGDGLERSCNIFFENMGDRLGLDGLNHWMHEFGLGEKLRIGIPETGGRVPGDVPVPYARSVSWFSGIGQAQVLATPLQMANVSATIARRGLSIRPHLLASETQTVPRRDLNLNQGAVDMAIDGMIRVVNGDAGTGTILRRDDILIAGKTGTAQAARFNLLELDANGNKIRDENGKPVRTFFEPSTPDAPNLKMPWYRGSGNSGSELGHAWMIGFAPAHNPEIAFAVLVEYGGSGGKDAGPVAQSILEACIKHGYLQTNKAK